MADEKRRHRVVGVRFPTWYPYCPQVLSGVVDFMRENESWKIVTENDGYGELESVRITADWNGDGVILFRATEEELSAFREKGIAVVLTSTEGPDLGFPRVVPDNAMIGMRAAEHLMGCGVPRFAFLARGETLYLEKEFAPGLRRYARERLAGYRMTLAGYSMEPVVHYLRGRPLWEERTWREIQKEVMDFLSQLPLPCGLFVVDDFLGVSALRAADRLGLRVPQDLAVIAFGNDPACCYASLPSLSSIPWPGREIGRAGASLLQQMMDGDDPGPGRTVIPVQDVVSRESSDTLAIDDPKIRDMIRHIRSVAPRDAIKVSELEDFGNLSMSSIKTRFRKYLGHGPKEEIQIVRLRHLTRLLEEDTLGLAEIAKRMGFGSTRELSRFFVSETGRKPGEFREALRRGKSTAQKNSPRAVVFDLDGTLFDTEGIYFEAYRRALARQGGELAEETYFRELMGRSNAMIERYIREISPPDFDEERFRADWRKEFYDMTARDFPPPLPGVRETLECLCEMGVSLALASSSDHEDIDFCLNVSGLSSYFPIRASGDEVEEGKPDPAVYHLVCRRLGLPPDACVVVEDSRHGQDAALAAGLKVVRVCREIPDECPENVRHVTTLERLAREDWEEILGTGTTAEPEKETEEEPET